MENDEITVTIPFWVDISVTKDAFMEDSQALIEKKMGLRTEIEGLFRHKRYLDEKYAEIDMKLGSKTLKTEKKHR